MKHLFVRHAWVVLMVVGGALAGTANAQTYRNLSSVHDSSGVMSTNTVRIGTLDFTNVSACGQPGGVFISSNPTAGLTNYAGFLQAVDIKRPNLDTDHDGVIDEISEDNDSDGLKDLAEVTGSGFDPVTTSEVNNPDTDGDTMPDGAESVSGTNPRDNNSLLEITAASRTGEVNLVEWSARGGKTYHIMAADGANFARPDQPIGTTTVVGGVAPWFETSAAFTNADAADGRYIAISPVP